MDLKRIKRIAFKMANICRSAEKYREQKNELLAKNQEEKLVTIIKNLKT